MWIIVESLVDPEIFDAKPLSLLPYLWPMSDFINLKN
jgi:hypothetical protein